jgi:hypothetical protein
MPTVVMRSGRWMDLWFVYLPLVSGELTCRPGLHRAVTNYFLRLGKNVGNENGVLAPSAYSFYLNVIFNIF